MTGNAGQNFRVTIQYDGTDYHGWQMQPNARTIQGELTRALTLLDGRSVTVHGAGRTDAGVHAEGQVANFILRKGFELRELREAINGNLDRDIRAVDLSEVGGSFHARLDAKSKLYRYRVWNGPVVPPFVYRYVHHYRDELDLDAMRSAALTLKGRHDFTSFTSVNSDVEDRIRTISRLEVIAAGNEIWIEAEADGFLRYMVRTIAGTLIEIGRGRRSPSSINEVLESRDRSQAGPTVSASGLTLVRVDY